MWTSNLPWSGLFLLNFLGANALFTLALIFFKDKPF